METDSDRGWRQVKRVRYTAPYGKALVAQPEGDLPANTVNMTRI
jgi:hypothetical protein